MTTTSTMANLPTITMDMIPTEGERFIYTPRQKHRPEDLQDRSRGIKRSKLYQPLVLIQVMALTGQHPVHMLAPPPIKNKKKKKRSTILYKPTKNTSKNVFVFVPPPEEPTTKNLFEPYVPPPTDRPWRYADETIYHETQDDLNCGRHALNNVLQGKVFTDAELYQSAFDVVETAYKNTGIVEPLEEHCTDRGMFSADVLKHVTKKKLGVELEYVNKDTVVTSTTHHGFLCNIVISPTMKHWIAIKEIGGIYYLMDSLNAQPIVINDLRMALLDIQMKNGTVFCLPKH